MTNGGATLEEDGKERAHSVMLKERLKERAEEKEKKACGQVKVVKRETQESTGEREGPGQAIRWLELGSANEPLPTTFPKPKPRR